MNQTQFCWPPVILVVDDDKWLLQTHKDASNAILGDLAKNAVFLGSGQEALDFLGKNEVGILVIDWVMPGISGMDILEAVSGGAMYKFVCSGSAGKTLVDARVHGATVYKKPDGLIGLWLRIKEIIMQMKE